MKRNQKGFTLVEIIGVIVIMGIIVTLGTNVYSTVSKRMKETAYENKKSYIENGAARYASETGYIITNVDELIKTGYIEADNERGEIKNPIDNSILNCKIVTISEENGNYYGELKEEEECNLGNIEVVNVNLEIKEYEKEITGKGKEIAEGEWTGKDVLLEINFKKTSVQENEIVKVVWKSGSGTEEIEVNNDYNNKKTKEITAEQIMNTSYEVEVIMRDGTKYQARRGVKIDKQRPVVYIEETEIENEAIYVNKDKKVTVKGSDMNGSGIGGYYIGTNRNCKEVEYEVEENGSYAKELDNGTYYVCVKDKVGNISEEESSKEVQVSRVDKEGPSCEWIGEATTWEKGSRTIELKGVDNESGTSMSKSWTFNSGTHQKERLEYEISDEAGNTTNCVKEVDVYIDNEAPECKWDGESDNWTNENRTITIIGDDKGIGSTSRYSWNYTNGTHKSENLSYEVKDNLGNTRTCSKDVNVYVDKEAPTCSWSGENGSWTKNDVTITVKGVDTGSGSNSISNWNYTSGTHSIENLSYQISDLAGNSVMCSKTANVYVDKEAPSCTINIVGTKGSNDWYTTNVNFNLVTNDAGSGLAYQYLSSSSLTTNTASYKPSAVVRDKVGNERSCNVTVKRDANAPSLTAKASKSYIREGQSSAISNYYNLSYSTSGGSISCTKNNINQIPFGLNYVTCTATGGNGKTASTTLTFGHEYDRVASGCSNGGSFQNGTCYFSGNESICGCSRYKSCERSEFGVAEYNSCQNEAFGCAEYSCTLYRKCRTVYMHYSNGQECIKKCSCGFCTMNAVSDYICPSSGRLVWDDQGTRSSECGTETVTGSACNNAKSKRCTSPKMGTGEVCGIKRYNSKESSLCGCSTAGSCNKSEYITYSCPRGGSLSGTVCRF